MCDPPRRPGVTIGSSGARWLKPQPDTKRNWPPFVGAGPASRAVTCGSAAPPPAVSATIAPVETTTTRSASRGRLACKRTRLPKDGGRGGALARAPARDERGVGRPRLVARLVARGERTVVDAAVDEGVHRVLVPGAEEVRMAREPGSGGQPDVRPAAERLVA